jgi:hypothetical protein
MRNSHHHVNFLLKILFQLFMHLEQYNLALGDHSRLCRLTGRMSLEPADRRPDWLKSARKPTTSPARSAPAPALFDPAGSNRRRQAGATWYKLEA